jgi:hypothetical protein
MVMTICKDETSISPRRVEKEEIARLPTLNPSQRTEIADDQVTKPVLLRELEYL